ncbi:winged helix-turn-helix transcriptional regulator [Flavobacterium sp. ZT3R17]|uniref:winged helix-turn-helix transcriptional regulator n=1 Tax=Flavobacterium cryoconiti TaxID=3398736 RepID=UPI003A8ACE85
MYDRKIIKEYKCGMEVTMEIIGGKWKPCLINYIHSGLKRPNELQKAIPNASRRALNIQLNELEQYGIISKKIFPVLPPKVEYSLTEEGKSLLPITLEMDRWGMAYKDKFLAIICNIEDKNEVELN